MKKRIVRFVLVLVLIISCLFLVRGIYIFLNTSDVKNNAFVFRQICESYGEIGENAAKNSEYLKNDNIKDFVDEYEKKLKEVSVDNNSLKTNVKTFESILIDFVKTKSYCESIKTDFNNIEVEFNLDCSEVVVHIDDNCDFVQYNMHNEKYILESRSTYELNMIKDNGEWKVRSWDISNFNSDIRTFDEE